MRHFASLLRALVCAALAGLLLGADQTRAQQTPALGDAEFWRLVTESSEESGTFPQQLMSNEDSAQFVMPALQKVPTGGAYIGVGAEQNFTYLAMQQPDVAFVLDIRRDNLLELLLYKAVFELSLTRGDFVCRLFSRVSDRTLSAATTVEALMAAAQTAAAPDDVLEANVRALLDTLVRTHGFALSDADQSIIRRMMTTFRAAGPRGLKGYGDRTNPTYEQFMTAADLDGHQYGFLSSEPRYAVVRTMERENRIIPVVGDFAGMKALPAIGRFLRDRQLTVRLFYVSNVERYLFEQGAHGQAFYMNVAALPLDDNSLFIRSVITDITERLNIPVPAGPARWRTFVFSIRDCLASLNDGRITTYRDLFTSAG